MKTELILVGKTNDKLYINGIKDYGDLAFKFNYAKEQFTTLNGLTGSIHFKVTLPDTTTATFSG
mgnify:FL=1